MGFKALTNLEADITVALGGFNMKLKKDNPTTAEGFFLGTKEIDNALSKTGKCKVHTLLTKKGNLGIWGKKSLDDQLARVTPGVMVRITATGEKKVKTGKMYTYLVEVDDSQTIEIAGLSATPANDSEPNFDADEELDAEDTYQDDEEAQNQALVAAEKKAALMAKLKTVKK